MHFVSARIYSVPESAGQCTLCPPNSVPCVRHQQRTLCMPQGAVCVRQLMVDFVSVKRLSLAKGLDSVTGLDFVKGFGFVKR